jgi:hypothetical protein
VDIPIIYVAHMTYARDNHQDTRAEIRMSYLSEEELIVYRKMSVAVLARAKTIDPNAEMIRHMPVNSSDNRYSVSPSIILFTCITTQHEFAESESAKIEYREGQILIWTADNTTTLGIVLMVREPTTVDKEDNSQEELEDKLFCVDYTPALISSEEQEGLGQTERRIADAISIGYMFIKSTRTSGSHPPQLQRMARDRVCEIIMHALRMDTEFQYPVFPGGYMVNIVTCTKDIISTYMSHQNTCMLSELLFGSVHEKIRPVESHVIRRLNRYFTKNCRR